MDFRRIHIADAGARIQAVPIGIAGEHHIFTAPEGEEPRIVDVGAHLQLQPGFPSGLQLVCGNRQLAVDPIVCTLKRIVADGQIFHTERRNSRRVIQIERVAFNGHVFVQGVVWIEFLDNRFNVDVRLVALPKNIVADGHIPGIPGFIPAVCIVRNKNRPHIDVPELVAFDQHIPAGGTEQAAAARLGEDIVADLHIRRIGDVFHHVSGGVPTV